jgi:transcriptional regulator with XRE-family HTH domain
MTTFNYAIMAAELVRAVRGKRTQRQIGKKAGFSSNVVYSWEAGRSNPAASVFFRMAAVGRSDLFDNIDRFAASYVRAFEARQLTKPEGVAQFMRELAADVPIASLARDLDLDRTTVTRWLRGRTEPRLPEMLRFVEQTTHRVLQFVELFTDPLQLSSTRAAFQSLTAQQRIAWELPMSHAVLRALELVDYQLIDATEQAAFIGQQTGLSSSEAVLLLRALAEADLIYKHKEKWHIRDVATVDTRRTIERDVELKRFWIDLALARLDTKRLAQSSLFSYNLFAVSQSSYEQIRSLHLDYYERVRRIVANDSAPQRVALLNLQLVALDE